MEEKRRKSAPAPEHNGRESDCRNQRDQLEAGDETLAVRSATGSCACFNRSLHRLRDLRSSVSACRGYRSSIYIAFACGGWNLDCKGCGAGSACGKSQALLVKGNVPSFLGNGCECYGVLRRTFVLHANGICRLFPFICLA